MTAMQWLRQQYPEVFGSPDQPVIETEWGPVTESARLQVAMNMREDPEKRAGVEAMLIERAIPVTRPANTWQTLKWKYAPLWLVKRWPVETRVVSKRERGLEEARRRYPEAYR